MPLLLDDDALLTLDRLDRDDDALSVRLAVLRVIRCSDVRRPDMESSVCGRKRGGGGRCRAAALARPAVDVAAAEAAAAAGARDDDDGGGPAVRGLVGGDSSVRDEAGAR